VQTAEVDAGPLAQAQKLAGGIGGVTPSSMGTSGTINTQAAQSAVQGIGNQPSDFTRNLQTFLNGRGYKLATDGIYGPQTDAAYKSYEQKLQQTQDQVRQDSYLTALSQRSQQNATLGNQAQQARANLILYANQWAAMKDPTGQAQKMAASAKQIATDSTTYDNTSVVGIYNNLQTSLSPAMRAGRVVPQVAPKSPGLLSQFAHGLADVTINPLNYALNTAERPFYAGQYAEEHGSGLAGQWRAFVGNVPGLGVVANSNKAAKQADVATHTATARQAAINSGQLATIGQYLTGNVHLRGQALQNYLQGGGAFKPSGRPLQLPTAVRGVGSGAADLLADVGLDPTNVLYGAGSLAKVGDVAGEVGLRAAALKAGLSLPKSASLLKGRLANAVDARLGAGAAEQAVRHGRLSYLSNSSTGRALLDKAVQAVAKNQGSSYAVTKVVKGLPTTVAQEVKDAAGQGEGAVRQALRKAFAEGTWNPKVRLSRQFTAAVTGNVGSGAVRRQTVLTAVQDFAHPHPLVAPRATSRTTQALDESIDLAAQRTGALPGDLRNLAVNETVGLPLHERMARVFDLAQTSGNAAFKRTVDGQLDDIHKMYAKIGNAKTVATRITEAAKAETALQRLEAAAYLLHGGAGDEARQAVEFGLTKGLRAPKANVVRTTEDVVRLAGKDFSPEETPYTDLKAAGLRAQVERDVPEELRPAFHEAIDRVAAKQGNLGRVEEAVRHVATDKSLATVVRGRIRSIADHIRQEAEASDLLAKPSLARRAVGQVVDMLEYAPRPGLRLEGYANHTISTYRRGEDISRYASALHLGREVMAHLRQVAEQAKTEAQLYKVVHEALVFKARQEGVDPRRLVRLLEDDVARFHGSRGYAIDRDGELVRTPQVTAQKIEQVPMPSVNRINQAVREAKVFEGHAGIATHARLKVQAVSNYTPPAMSKSLGDLTSAGHELWKRLIVTNVGNSAIGLAAGLSTPGADWKTRLRNAGIGAVIGLAGPIRYVARVVGLEERVARWFFDQGFQPQQWIPVLAKWARTAGLPDERRLLSADVVRSGNWGEHLQNKFLTTVDPENWVDLAPGHARFVDGWYRILNQQLPAETDIVAYKLLQERAGVITSKEADKDLAIFAKSEPGKQQLARMRISAKGPKDFAQLVKQYRTFIKAYVPPDLAAGRLVSRFTHDYLMRYGKDHRDLVPERIHAQKTWIMPKNIGDVFKSLNQLSAKAILEGPTNRWVRVPLAENIFRQEYGRLVRGGMSPERAQLIADETAVRRTNGIMLQKDNSSRFAKKVDWAFPFQQPREEMLRAYGNLLSRSGGRNLLVAEDIARAFNNGENNGIFRQDSYGDWVMSIPGSAYISRALFGVNASFDAKLKDFLFFSQGAYGIGAIPSLGGPYWTVASRIVQSAAPDFFASMNPALRNIIFPYGNSGQILRNESSRLWMAMVGNAAPWEFASKQEQNNEINKYRVEVYLQLLADHRRAFPGDLKWQPDMKTVDSATQDFFKVWTLMGSVFPGAPQPNFPGEDAYNTLKKAYTNAITGKLDYNRLIADHPEFAPYTFSRTKYVGPNDWAHWTRSDAQKAQDTVNHYRTDLTLPEFEKQISDSQRATAAYNERKNIYAMPSGLDQRLKLEAWEAKYPDLATTTRTDYFRNFELAQIIHGYSKNQQQSAIDSWRKRYNVTFTQYQTLKQKVLSGASGNYSPWSSARYPDDVWKAVQSDVKKGNDEGQVVANLAPAEQYLYWQYKADHMGYTPVANDPQATANLLTAFNLARQNQSAVISQYPFLLQKSPSSTTVDNAWKDAINTWRGNYEAQLNASYAELTTVDQARQNAINGGDWTSYYALKAKADALNSQILAIKNQAYRQYPELNNAVDDMKSITRPNSVSVGGKTFAGQYEYAPNGTLLFVPSDEEQHFINMPTQVKTAYLDDLYSRLNQASGSGKLFWSWLTSFQQNLLSAHMPQEVVNGWKGQQPGAGLSPSDTGFSGSFYAGHDTIQTGAGELAYAKQMLEEYSKRPAGAQPPAGYADYLSLPSNGTLRSQYLAQHPEVSAWIKSGPLSNMPALDRLIVVNILTKYGKFGTTTGTPSGTGYATVNGTVPITGGANGAPVSRQQFATDLLNKLGAPITTENVKAVVAWAQAEGGGGALNPLNTTRNWDASGTHFAASNFNGDGVKNFVNYSDAVAATAATIQQSNMQPILDALMSGTSAIGVAQAVAATKWGTGGGVLNVLNAGQYDAQKAIQSNTLGTASPPSTGKSNTIATEPVTGTGGVMSTQEITDLAYAEQQLSKYSMRGNGTAPSTYDTWVNMPSGQAKAEYLQAHPEVTDWLRKGPLENMPDQVRQVVSDIMTQYGQWTQQQNPLSDVIAGYYATPNYQSGMGTSYLRGANPNAPTLRQQYLSQHPELAAYWAATRTPQQNAMSDLYDQYSALPNPGAKALFMSAHPDLETYLLNQRNDRYEQFLNQVAALAGNNPDILQNYLRDQTGLLAELVKNYATPVLAREAPRQVDTHGLSGTSQSGRTRD
jgi:hypothetical protein